MRIIAFLEDHKVINKIIVHLYGRTVPFSKCQTEILDGSWREWGVFL